MRKKIVTKSVKNKVQNTGLDQSILLGGDRVDYTLIRDSYKTLRLRVKADASVEVKAPKRYQQVFIDTFLQKKASWIKEKRGEALDKGAKPQMDFSHGSSCFCLGREFVFHYSALFDGQILNACSAMLGMHRVGRGLLNFWQGDILENEGQFLCRAELYRDFANIADAAHRGVRLGVRQSVQSAVDAGDNPPFVEVSSHLTSFLFVKAKDVIRKTGQAEIMKIGQAGKVEEDQAEEIMAGIGQAEAGKNCTANLDAWRKKTAELFLQVCLDKVWDNLCGANCTEINVQECDSVGKNQIEYKEEADRISPVSQVSPVVPVPFVSQIPPVLDFSPVLPVPLISPASQVSPVPPVSKAITEIFRKIKKPSLRVRVLSRRFGSCSTKGEICLARHLISFPLELIEYVIIHECCHLVHMNHSKFFYELMEKTCGNARKKRELLWDWSRKHSQF